MYIYCQNKTRNKLVHFKIYTNLYECECARAYVTKVALYYYSAYLTSSDIKYSG